MKNQYFGDINDYRKYGLLRVLQSTGSKLLVAWMPASGSKESAAIHPATMQPRNRPLPFPMRWPDAEREAEYDVRCTKDDVRC